MRWWMDAARHAWVTSCEGPIGWGIKENAKQSANARK